VILYLIKQLDGFLDAFLAYTLAGIFWIVGWVIEE